MCDLGNFAFEAGFSGAYHVIAASWGKSRAQQSNSNDHGVTGL